MHILIAPNAFKNSLSASAVAGAIQEGLSQSKLQFTCECFPIGDGGDGTMELIISRLNGTMVPAEVQDPLGRRIKSSFGLAERGKTAVIEMADASGLRLLAVHERNPLRASSFGTGELLKQALDQGVKNILLGMGGSATVDGGCGILKAMGLRFLDAGGRELSGTPESLLHLQAMDTSALDQRIFDCAVTVLCDVDNPLLGSAGAAAVFGPQKGAQKSEVDFLEDVLERFATITYRETGKDITTLTSGGAAGGAAAGLYAFLDARLVNGIDHFLQLTGFESALQKCDLIITGEGSIDEQTLNGKGPFGVACRAKKKGLPVIGIAGRVPIDKSEKMQHYFDVLLSIGNEPCALQQAFGLTEKNLVRTARELGTLLSLRAKI